MATDPHIAERRNQQRVDSIERTRVRNQTAEQLQIGSATLYRKLKSYGLIGSKRPGPQGQPMSS